MTRFEFEEILALGALSSIGHIDGIEFNIMQSESFADSKNNVIDAKFLAFLPNDIAPVQTYCNTVDELLRAFIVNGEPIGAQLDRITDFHSDACFD